MAIDLRSRRSARARGARIKVPRAARWVASARTTARARGVAVRPGELAGLNYLGSRFTAPRDARSAGASRGENYSSRYARPRCRYRISIFSAQKARGRDLFIHICGPLKPLSGPPLRHRASRRALCARCAPQRMREQVCLIYIYRRDSAIRSDARPGGRRLFSARARSPARPPGIMAFFAVAD